MVDQHADTQAPSPDPLNAAFAATLALTKAELLAIGGEGVVHQTGGALIDGPVDIADLSGQFPDLSAPLIETFLIGADGSCSPTGTDQRLIDAVAATAASVAEQTLAALERFAVSLELPGYLTASVTPVEQVTSTPHADDDQFMPDDGVGIVAVVGDGLGPRIAIDPVPHLPTRPGLPLDFGPDAADRFDDGSIRSQQVAANRLVVLPQFGQLHAGPTATPNDHQRRVRTLFVFRLRSLGGAPGRGIGPSDA